MQLEYDFTVPVPVREAWTTLLDLEQVVPCLPGATLTLYDGESFVGTVRVKVGPVSLTYQGKGQFVSRDADAGRVVIEASGREARGAGTAATTATMTLRPAADAASTVVTVQAELSVTGRPAQFGRGMIADVGGKLVGQFADCLAQRLAESRAPAADVADASPANPTAAGESGAPTGDGALAGPTASAADLPSAPIAPAADFASAADLASAPAAPAAHFASAADLASAPAAPVDLLRVGAGPLVRRITPYAIGFLAGVLVARSLWRRRRARHRTR